MPDIETERIRMRLYTREDADEQLRIVSDAEFKRYFADNFLPTRDSTLIGIGRFLEHWSLRGHGVWALELLEEPRMFGYCGLRYLPGTQEVELLYGADRAFWGRGLVTEAARASLRYGFETMNFDRIMAITAHENLGSRRVMEKSGMKYEKEAVYFGLDCVYYAINREDWSTGDAPYKLIP
jgi:RimJ/RimL family protein N-acetyltransferase